MEKIEPGLKIPGLRDSLIQILRDFNLQVTKKVWDRPKIGADSGGGGGG